MVFMKKEILGVLKFQPEQITLNRGHEYGAGRTTRVHQKSRKAQRRRNKQNGWRDE